MKIQNGILISVNDDDIIKGVFRNSKIIGIAHNCFENMPHLKKVVCKNVTTSLPVAAT